MSDFTPCVSFFALNYDRRLNGMFLFSSAFLTHYSSIPEPRYASLPNIMKAKKKPVQTFTPEDLGVDFTPQFETLKVAEPPARIGGGKVANVDELIGKLKEAGLV